MKQIVLVVIAIALCATAVHADQVTLIDFGKCKLEVTRVRQIDSFIGEKGKPVRASRRDTRLVEVELTIESYATGEMGLYPAMFGAMFVYRGVTMVVPAAAIGTKVVDRMSGETREYWYDDPEVSIILGISSGERFVKHIVLEIPKEVKDVRLQGPMSIDSFRLNK